MKGEYLVKQAASWLEQYTGYGSIVFPGQLYRTEFFENPNGVVTNGEFYKENVDPIRFEVYDNGYVSTGPCDNDNVYFDCWIDAGYEAIEAWDLVANANEDDLVSKSKEVAFSVLIESLAVMAPFDYESESTSLNTWVKLDLATLNAIEKDVEKNVDRSLSEHFLSKEAWQRMLDNKDITESNFFEFDDLFKKRMILLDTVDINDDELWSLSELYLLVKKDVSVAFVREILLYTAEGNSVLKSMQSFTGVEEAMKTTVLVPQNKFSQFMQASAMREVRKNMIHC